MKQTATNCECGLAWEHTGKHAPMTEHKTNYVDSRTPEEREADNKIKVTTTSATANVPTENWEQPSPEKESCEWEKEFDNLILLTQEETWDCDAVCGVDRDQLKSFIRKLLLSARQEERAGSYSRSQMVRLIAEKESIARQEADQRVAKRAEEMRAILLKKYQNFGVPIEWEGDSFDDWVNGYNEAKKDSLIALADLSANIK